MVEHWILDLSVGGSTPSRSAPNTIFRILIERKVMKNLTGELFEFHITGDKSIHRASEGIGIKTISIDLLKPNLKSLRTEHMTSQIGVYKNYEHSKIMLILLPKHWRNLASI